MESRIKRRTKLVNPKLQLKLIGLFVGLAAGSALVQLFILGLDLRLLADGVPDGGVLKEAIPGVLMRSLLFTAGMWIPMTIGIGIVITHRIAGPVYRIEQYLRAVARGESHGPCRIREDDEFQELCELVNEAFESTSARSPRSATREGIAQPDEAARIKQAA